MKLIRIKSCKDCPYRGEQPLKGQFCLKAPAEKNKLYDRFTIPEWCPLPDEISQLRSTHAETLSHIERIEKEAETMRNELFKLQVEDMK